MARNVLTAASIFSGLAFGSDAVPASRDVSCVSYQPIGWNTTNAKINFYNNNPTNNPANGHGFEAPTLPDNATISSSSNFVLSDKTPSDGYSFTLSACNVSSLGITTNTTQSSCSHSGCYTTYTNYVQVHDSSNRCLTISQYNANASSLDFEQCDQHPKDQHQYFLATQQVLYNVARTKLVSYGIVDFENVQNFSTPAGETVTGAARAWALSRANNRTIETIRDSYTQVGLSASLLQA